MTCRIQNLTRRLVSIRGNSGETWHLPPKVSIDLMNAEATDNAMIAKLVAKGVISLQHQESAEPVSQTARKRPTAAIPTRRGRITQRKGASDGATDVPRRLCGGGAERRSPNSRLSVPP